MHPIYNIKDGASLRRLSRVMKTAAEAFAVPFSPEGSTNAEEAAQNAAAADVRAFLKVRIERGDLSYISLGGIWISLDLTLETHTSPPQWHLSMGRFGPPLTAIPMEVDDPLALEIAHAFSSSMVESQRSTGFAAVRHFFAPFFDGDQQDELETDEKGDGEVE